MLYVQTMWGIHGSPSSSLSYSMSCGQWCLACLVFTGLCCKRSLSCLLLGKEISVSITIQLCGFMCHIALCGVIGMNGILDILGDANILFQRLSLSSSFLCSSGAQLYNFFLFLLFLFCLIIVFWDLNCIAPIVHFLSAWVCYFDCKKKFIAHQTSLQ